MTKRQELDAMALDKIAQLVREAIERYWDHDAEALILEEQADDPLEQLSNVVDDGVKDHQAATLSSVISLSLLSSSVTLTPSLNFTPSSTSPTSSWPLNRRQRSWAASSSL